MKKDIDTLGVQFGKKAEQMLVEFANTRPELEAFERFRRKWEKVSPLKWRGDHKSFCWDQSILREIWEGHKRGIEGFQLSLCLGIEIEGRYTQEEEYIAPSVVAIDWDESSFSLTPHTLDQVVWLTLLQHSQRLAVCANYHKGDSSSCQTPYFVRYRPRQKYCSDACALPSQREFKRRWWNEHGKEWTREHQAPRKERRSETWTLDGKKERKQATPKSGKTRKKKPGPRNKEPK